MSPRIVVKNVSRSYGETLAVDNISFSVPAGKVVGLLGPNGAGKTTTLRMLATLLKPDQGTIHIDDYDVVEQPLAVRKRIGYQTGDTGLYGRLNPVEFLRYFGQLHGMDKKELAHRVEVVTKGFEIDAFARQRCSDLSTGQRQRVSLARALLHDPPIVILDEPTSGLDIVSSSFVLDTLRKARDEGRALLFSTHILSEAELVCDEILVMHRAKIIARGSVAELRLQTDTESLSRAFLKLIEDEDGAREQGTKEADGEREEDNERREGGEEREGVTT